MCEELRLERYDNSPWGFRLTGGLDFGTPLGIIKVTGGSIAEEAGVKAGDLVKSINGRPTTHFTHLDAQKCIASSGNYLTLTVMRGSVVTPGVSPTRGLSPTPSCKSKDEQYIHDSPTVMKTAIEIEIMDYYNRGVGMRDGPRSPVPVYQKPSGQKATIAHDKLQYRLNDEGQLFFGDRALTDFEIAELMTSNEEVLDQGVLGINFKKFLPKVDFIRKSEVFKMLQSENTKKEISEQAQLQKEPTKRFSTFLMKPKPLKEQRNLAFVKFKPPRYLPKPPEKKWELPKLKPWERPKKKEPEHSVLWLFLEEKGEEIIDERWGTEEEERINMSRNSFIEYDRSCMSSSLRMHEDDASSLTSRDHYGHDSQASKYEHEAPYNKQHVALQNEEGNVYDNRHVNIAIQDEISTSEQAIIESEIIVESGHDQQEVKQTSKEHIGFKEETKEFLSSEEGINNEKIVDSKLVAQLADIKNQIEALENEAPSDLQTQLLAVKKQLSKIVDIKTSAKEEKKVQESYDEGQTTKECFTSSEQKDKKTQIFEHRQMFESCEASEFEEQSVVTGDIELHTSAKGTQVKEESVIERREFAEEKTEKHIEVSTYQVEELEETEFQLCCASTPKTKEKPQPKKKAAHPITPQLRPIVLPGGRMWRQPKDAEHEEFYQGILVAQADVLIGTTENLNYTKYMPPKVDMTTSEVYRLIHETEDGISEAYEEEDYHPPISKRHFYAATLREPPPIGVVELSDL